MLETAAPAHLASVRRHFVDRLSPGDLAAVERIAERLTGAPAPHDWMAR